MSIGLINNNFESEAPTLVLADRAHRKIGVINNIANDFVYIKPLARSPKEISFTMYKELDGKLCNYWDDIKDTQLVYVVELNEYYEIFITINESDTTTKFVNGIHLPESELSQIIVYDLEINTSSDILREDYTVPTVFYKKNDTSNSFLHRLLYKAPHYSIKYVDISLWNIQRVFSFDSEDIYSITNAVSEELDCIFIFDSTDRTICVYDLLDYCYDCGHRETSLNGICTECGSTNIKLGYGDDTTIFLNTENLSSSITLESNSDNLKNCFKLKAGDELMTATVKQINPNGSDYIYSFSNDTLDLMPQDLVNKINEYNTFYNDIISNYSFNVLDNGLKDKYNALVNKYNSNKYANYQYNDEENKVLTNNEYMPIDSSLKGYDSFINLYYSNIDFELYLQSSLLPTVVDTEATSMTELAKLTNDMISPIGLSEIKSSTSSSTVESAIKVYLKILLNTNFKISLTTSSYDYAGKDNNGWNYGEWKGKITITNYYDETDTATSDFVTIKVLDNYETYVQQKLLKALKGDDEYGSVSNIITINNINEFTNALAYYSLNRLNSFKDAYQSALDILIELGQATLEADFYNEIYIPYRNKKLKIEAEIKLRETEIALCQSVTDLISKDIAEIQNNLSLESFLGVELWLLLNAYKREDTYENTNYISDGLDNAQLIEYARKFTDAAIEEINKASQIEYSLTSTISNFLILKEFKVFTNQFDVGNWIRGEIDGVIYKLRLNNVQLTYTDTGSSIDIDFSTVVKNTNSINDVQKILESAKNISTSYPYTAQAVEQAKNTGNIVDNWVQNGFDATANKIMNSAINQNVIYDKNGILCRSYNDITDNYEKEQLKVVNSTLAITDDDWETVKAAIGKYYYKDPLTGELKTAYGVIGDVVIGRLLLGQNLGIYDDESNQSMSFDSRGLVLNTTDKDGNGYKKIIDIQKDGESMLYIDNEGNLVLVGLDLLYKNITELESITGQLKTRSAEFEITVESIRAQIREINSAIVGTKNYLKGLSQVLPTATGSNSASYIPNSDTLRLAVVNSGTFDFYKTNNFIDSFSPEITPFSLGVDIRVVSTSSISAPITIICGEKASDFTITEKNTTITLEDFDFLNSETFKITINKSGINVDITILSLVNGSEYKAEQFGLQEVSTAVAQTSDAVEFVKTGLTQIQDDLGNYVLQDELREYIRFSGATIELGTSASNFKTLITNEEIGFYDGATKVAYISNSALLITNAVIKDTLRIGNFVWSPRQNGNLSLFYSKEG